MHKLLQQLLHYLVLFLFLNCPISSAMAEVPDFLSQKNLAPILLYIKNGWKSLERSSKCCQSLEDNKISAKPILYLPSGISINDELKEIQRRCKMAIISLPKKIRYVGDINPKDIPIGLLYLPHTYIVPGGRFNEMYGWDSYFIILGLLADKQFYRAYAMLDNLFFELDHYGAILNANRSYYLTRSQPPFLTSMIRAVFKSKPRNKENLLWLEKAYQYALKDYIFWTSPPHLVKEYGLSRYVDFNEGPVPELEDLTKSYYHEILKYFTKRLPFNHKAVSIQQNKLVLSDHFYQGDRAMRESGFDTTFRFGPYSAETVDYLPVDLNSLLYKAEMDLAWMSTLLKKPEQVSFWKKKANERKTAMNRFLWNEEAGLFFDYNFVNKTQSKYIYASTFYPLWVRQASSEQANKIKDHLVQFEKPGGIVMSPYKTGEQWDYPYGWAPLQLITTQGLLNYRYSESAERIMRNYLKMVIKNFSLDGVIHEKYDVVKESAITKVKVGYTENAIGFGWTNGVFLVLLEKLNKLSEIKKD